MIEYRKNNINLKIQSDLEKRFKVTELRKEYVV